MTVAKKQADLKRIDKVVAAMARRNETFGEIASGFILRDGARYCKASALRRVLGYKTEDSFRACIDRAQITASSTGRKISEHFVVSNLFDGDTETLLSEWAAYATVMEADPKLPNVALAKSFFATLAEREAKHQEDRLRERQAFRTLNRRMHGAAKQAGITTAMDHAIFEDHGYKGMYGMSLRDVERHKSVPANERLIDRADHTEIAANNLRMSMTADRIERNRISTKRDANAASKKMGEVVRKAVVEGNDGTAPEDLPLAPSHINELAREKARELSDAGA